MPPKMVKSPTAEYEYSKDDIIEIIARDLGVPTKSVTLRFVETPVPGEYDDRFTTYDHSIVVSVEHPVKPVISIRRSIDGAPLPRKQETQKWSSEPDVYRNVCSILKNKLNVTVDVIKYESNLTDDLGLDSLNLFELIMHAEDVFDIQIPDEKLEKVETVQEVVNIVMSCLAEPKRN